MKLRKLTKKDEFLKLNGLVNDKEVNKAIEEESIKLVNELETKKKKMKNNVVVIDTKDQVRKLLELVKVDLRKGKKEVIDNVTEVVSKIMEGLDKLNLQTMENYIDEPFLDGTKFKEGDIIKITEEGANKGTRFLVRGFGEAMYGWKTTEEVSKPIYILTVEVKGENAINYMSNNQFTELVDRTCEVVSEKEVGEFTDSFVGSMMKQAEQYSRGASPYSNEKKSNK